MNLRLAVCLGLASHYLVGAALAQPALERVEKQLRKQTTVRTAAAEDAAADDETAAPDQTIPADNAEPAADTDPTDKSPPGYLGILGDDRRENGKGVRVTRTDAGGPAAKGGLKVGDLITAVDDLPVKTMQDMGDIMITRHAGARVKFSIDRGGAISDVQVRLERRPPPEKRLVPQFGKQAEEMPGPGALAPGASPTQADPGSSTILRTRRPKLGITTDYLTPFIREQARLPGSYVAGVFVTFVDPDSPAGKAALPKGAIITSVDGAPIDSPDTLAGVVHRAGPGQVLNVTYYFHDHETQSAITLAGGPQQPPAPGPQATVRAKPLSRAPVPPEQPPGFAPDEPDVTDMPAPVDKITELERRIAELEKRVAELEAAADADKK